MQACVGPARSRRCCTTSGLLTWAAWKPSALWGTSSAMGPCVTLSKPCATSSEHILFHFVLSLYWDTLTWTFCMLWGTPSAMGLSATQNKPCVTCSEHILILHNSLEVVSCEWLVDLGSMEAHHDVGHLFSHGSLHNPSKPCASSSQHNLFLYFVFHLTCIT